MTPENSIGIESLPNEILINILSLFPTRLLLPLTSTCHRVHDLIARIIYHRLHAAATIADHQLIFECYHPSTNRTTPYYFCEYLSTDTIDDGSGSARSGQKCGTIGKLHGLYSHFRPMQPEGGRRVWMSNLTGRWPPATLEEVPAKKEGLVSQNVDLESYELFSQLQSTVNLVKTGPQNGLFLGCTKVAEGLTRVWRDWLAERAKSVIATRLVQGEPREEHEKRLLWSSMKEDIGLRLRVSQRDDVRAPLPRGRYEEPDVGYTLEYEELVVRSSQLLLMLEQSLEQEGNHKGMLCGLDGVYMGAVLRGSMVEDAMQTQWRPIVEAF